MNNRTYKTRPTLCSRGFKKVSYRISNITIDREIGDIPANGD